MKVIATAILVAALAPLAGCFEQDASIRTTSRQPVDNTVLAGDATRPGISVQPQATYLGQATLADKSTQANPSGVDIALEWSAKYAQISEQLLKVQRENRELSDKNRSLEGEMNNLRRDLQGAQKELNDANAMLIEMRGQLEDWKKNVLGFRQEIRDAQRAQLEATAKVLKLLGGEMTTPKAPPAETAAAPEEQKDASDG